jgi:purine nucleoside permease
MDMRHAVCGLLLVLVSCSGGDDDDDAAQPKSLCERGCDTTTTLGCSEDKPASCVTDCEAMLAGLSEHCKTEVKVYSDCALVRPASDYECNSAGNAALKSEVCSDEYQAVLACVAGG